MAILDKGFSYDISQRYQDIDELIYDITTLTETKVNLLGGTSVKESRGQPKNGALKQAIEE